METGLTTSVLAGANVAKAMSRRPDLDTEQNSLAQDDLRETQGYVSLENAPVEHVSPDREGVKGLPKTLETSPLDMPQKRPSPAYSPSQKPGRPGMVSTGSRSRRGR
jgi:hypothetical protein